MKNAFTDEDLAVVLCNLDLDRAKTLDEIIPDGWDRTQTFSALIAAANHPSTAPYRGLCSYLNESVAEPVFKLTPEGDAWLVTS